MSDNYLSELANKYSSDKGTLAPSDGKHHGPRLNFTTIYHQYFEPIRYYQLNILEIGIGSGPSLKMWYDYFPNANIHAIDIDNCTKHENDRVKTYIADQSNRSQLQNIVNKTCKLDIIIDDGGHMMGQQQISFGCLFPHLKSGGYYFIEDLHTSYWETGRKLYNNTIDINDNRSNTTVKMIEDYIACGEIISQFLTSDEMSYLNETIDKAELFDLPTTPYGPNQLGLFIKK